MVKDTRTPKHSAMTLLLLSLVPYTEQNIALTFRPHHFFNELERASGYSSATLRKTMWRARQRGYINNTHQNVPTLTTKAQKILLPYVAQKLEREAELMLIFDIPEIHANRRRQLRLLLRQWQFEQVQKSVWVTRYDYRNLVATAIKDLKLSEYVIVYECSRLIDTS